MLMNWRPIRQLTTHLALLLWALSIGIFMPWQSAEAGVPVTIYQSFAGDINFTATGGTLRTEPNTGNACAVTNSDSATLSGIPAGSTITAAYLYWAGSGATPDYNVTFDGVAVTADRTFTEIFINGGTTYDFFSGFEDVTAQVANKVGGPNGTYTFANLTVNNGAPHCGVSAVLSGWSLMVVYENTAEPLRVVNVFDGFQYFRGSSLTLIPSNFRTPSILANIDGKHGILTWEGDVGNSASLGGFNEALTFNGLALTDGFNPINNQFNSTINILSSNTSYGVDLDIYPLTVGIGPGFHLNPDDTAATSVYSSGADLVLLSMEVLSVTNTPVADLAINKTHSGNFTVGQNGSYTLSVSNNGPSSEPGGITVTDTLPAGLSYVSATGTGWTCGAVGQDVTCTHVGPLANGASLPDITLTVGVAAAAAPSVTNTASVAGTAFDNQAGNDSSSDLTTVLQPDLSTSTKSVVDLNGGDADPGDTLRYTITLIESGGVAATNVSVTDNLPTNTTNLSVVSYPAGATDNSTAALLDISNISLVASGSDTIVFDVTVSGSANPGDLIDNTATITNPNGPGATPAGPTVTVSASLVAASGIKNLYFGAPDNENAPTQPQAMSRTPLTATPAVPRVRIRRQDAPRVWAQTPATQASLSLSAGFTPVILQMQRNNATQTRNMRVTLDYVGAATGVLGTVDINVPTDTTDPVNGLSNTVTRSFTFPVPTVAVTLPAGTQIRVTVDNSPTGGNARAVFVYPYDAVTGTSHVQLNATTVINVDSVQFYDDAYPGGSTITTTVPGAIVYVRAVVSDPFGDFDISAANITILDQGGTPVISGADLAPSEVVEVPSDNLATKTYDYAYTIPPTGQNGNWTAQVVATEGTEGTITHQRNASITVSGATLSIVKTQQTTYDPINGTTNPFNIPGAHVLYNIQVTNTAVGSADDDTVVVTDAIPANTKLCVTTIGNCVAPSFSDGSTSSGLTAAAFEYSFVAGVTACDNASFIGTAPTADTNGYDPNVTCIRQRPTGSMNGSGGFFDVQFTVGIQ